MYMYMYHTIWMLQIIYSPIKLLENRMRFKGSRACNKTVCTCMCVCAWVGVRVMLTIRLYNNYYRNVMNYAIEEMKNVER